MILDDPEMFLHHVDFSRRVAVFVKVTRRLIERHNAHNFDDIEPKYTAGLDQLLPHACVQRFPPPHFLFMTDFCGSTLLANGLRVLRGVNCLYEVRAFANLAIHKRALDRNTGAGPAAAAAIEDWQCVLQMVIAAMARTSDHGDTLIVKEWPPTNYIISDILRCDERIRAIFLYSGLEDYLNAVFRRSWRREFTRRRVVTELVETDLWPAIDENKRLFSDGKIAAAHWLVQQQAFLGLEDALLPRIHSLHSSEWYARPVETLTAIAMHFGIVIEPEEAALAFASVSGRHSKDREKPYGMTHRLREMELTARNHRQEIADAIAEAKIWMEAYRIPAGLPSNLYLDGMLTSRASRTTDAISVLGSSR